MKKYSFILLLLFCLSSVSAGTAKFKTLTVFVPEQWNSSKDADSLTISSPENDIIVRIMVFPTEGYSLKSLSEAMSGQVNGTKPTIANNIAFYSYVSPDSVKTEVYISIKGPMVIMVFVSGQVSKENVPNIQKILDSVF